MMFVPLHVHTEYSLLDGAARLDKLVDKAVRSGMPALAITDHGVMYGVIDFYKACKKAGIKPIIGCEVYVAPNSRFEKNPGKDERNHHLVLLAENEEGYRNLIYLVSMAHVEGFYYKPRVDKALLRQHAQGLIALSACLAGEVSDCILHDQMEEACKAARAYEEIFGKGNFYLEVQDHGMAEQRKVNAGMWKVHGETGIPMVATNDSHYVEKEDAFVQDVLLCIQTGKTLADNTRLSFSSQEMYVKTEAEMNLLFGDHPELLENTGRIAERCNVEFRFGQHYLPDFTVPAGMSLESYLREECERAFATCYPDGSEEQKERLEYELGIISETGFAGYFLIVADFCRYAREHGVVVGPGRGSAAASMVAYLLGITSVEPLAHDLLFERFLNPERISMPDIDIDFDPEGREKVIRYVTEKYGADKVCQIITFGTMGAKGSIRDVGRVMGIPLARVDKVAKAIPNDPGMTLEKALSVSGELSRMIEEDDQLKELYRLASAIEGMPRHASTHAAGVVIAKEALTHYLPLQKTSDGFLMTQFPMKTVEEIGLLKMDFLGLRNLTILHESVQWIERNRGIKLDLNRLPLDDAKTYELLSRGESSGVFQLESGGMRSVLKDLKPTCFEDIVAVNALYRPGPMEQIPEFIRRKHGGKIDYLHPKLEPILRSTYGIIVYQEQVMQIARDLAGYSLGRADLLRRAMGKKKKEIMEEERHHFIHGLQDETGKWVIEGALRLGIPQDTAEAIFALMAKFAQYGFNKGHATAYAVISYQTAYLKANYPLEFMAALLSTVMDSSDKIAYYIQEARNSGIEILPPDVQFSQTGFSLEKQGIRFGLGAIRNVGVNVVEKILEAREDGPFQSFYDFCLRVDGKVLNKRVLESLIKAGAFASLATRAQALAGLDQVLNLALRRQKEKLDGQMSLFDFDGGMEETVDLPDVPELPDSELLALEKEYLGLYLSGHPLSAVLPRLQQVTTSDIATCLEQEKEDRVILGGVITGYRQNMTRKGEMMGSFVLEDLVASVEVLLFPRVFARLRGLENDQIVIVEGRYSIQDEERKIFAENVTLLDDYEGGPPRRSVQGEKGRSGYGSGRAGFEEQYGGNGNGSEPPATAADLKQKKLYLRFPKEDPPLMEAVIQVLRQFPGPNPVYFYFEQGKKLIAANRDFWIREKSDIEAQLAGILGAKNVAWK